MRSGAAASIQGHLATGPRAGRRVRRVLSDPIEGLRSGALCFSARGFSLHAATRIEAEDRAGLERLCRYVARPPRRLNLVRYHGILAPNARYRSQVVPDSPAPAVSTAPDASAPSIYPHRFTWAALLARVFAVDVTVCPACGGPLRLIAVLSDPAFGPASDFAA